MQTILSGPVIAALVTAVALGLQNWLQRRASTRQRRDDQAHELAMAEQRHRADLERLDREASHRRREANQDRLQAAHRDLLKQLDGILEVAIVQRVLVGRLPGPERNYGEVFALLRDQVFSLYDKEEELLLLASKEVIAAASAAHMAAEQLLMECGRSMEPPGMKGDRYKELVADLNVARDAYREAMRLDIGAA